MKTAALLIPLLMLTACGGATDGDAPVPRRYAYPRPNLYTEEYQIIDGNPSLELNRGAAISSDSIHSNGARWLTIDYPLYNGTVYATFLSTTPAEFPSEIENRLERISLNAGSGSVENLSFTSEGGDFHCELFTARGESVNPVQFLAYNSGHTLVAYGTFNFNREVEVSRTDSLAPVVNSIRRDMTHLLKHLDGK